MARDDEQDVGADGRRKVLSRLARRLMDPRELGGDALDALGSILETSDRAKTEMVKMLAREARNYLDELRLKEGIRDLITSHSLEMKVSLSLKPLASAADAPAPAPASDPPREGHERSPANGSD
jgi:hypothetical protein